MNKLVIAALVVVGMSLNNVVGRTLEVVPSAVLDLDGNPLISGKQYQMMIGNNAAAAIGVSKINGTCPLYVVQQSLTLVNTTFITISNQVKHGANPLDIIKGLIVVHFASNLEFGCLESPVWQVVQQAVQTGGKLGESLFRIARIAFDKDTDMDMGMSKPVYKLQFCPFEVNSCQDIGISPDSITSSPVVNLLSPIIQGLNITPLRIQFKRVK
ncbi:uncharacterized protein LOC141641957 [Silene latifolia]|uniref:uncharacterized protein LOC141641957 n=1 Tax=Silene latifolia TaxID=37657 RepID=UPI003D76E6CB